MRTPRIAVIGYGRFGYRHATIVDQHPQAVLVGIADISSQAREAAAARLPHVPVYDDPEHILDDCAPDGVIIVTDPRSQQELVTMSLSRGIHVFCEKPLAHSSDSARELAELARAKDRVLQVGYVLRYETRHRMLKEEVQAGRLGELVHLRLRRNCSKAWFEAYGERAHPVYETLLHDIDLALWLTEQRCRRVTAWQRHSLRDDAPETFIGTLELERGPVASLETIQLIPSAAPVNITGWGEAGTAATGVIDGSIEVHGTEGIARLQTYDTSFQIVTSEQTFVPDACLWPTTMGVVGGALRDELWDFISQVSDGDGGVFSADDFIHGHEIAAALIAAASQGVSLELAMGADASAPS